MKEFVLCIKNENYPASLEKGKVYQSLADPKAETVNHIRVIDESGEDYLYPVDLFVSLELPQIAQEALLSA